MYVCYFIVHSQKHQALLMRGFLLKVDRLFLAADSSHLKLIY